jgi:hypothetical protein
MVQQQTTARKALSAKEEDTAWLQELPEIMLIAADDTRYLLDPQEHSKL